MYRAPEQGSITNLCCAPSFETAVSVGTGGGDSVHLRGLWRVREGEFVTAQGQRLPLGAGGMEIADGECEIKKHVPWRDGLDEIGDPELREVCYVPRDMASSSSSSSFASSSTTTVIRQSEAMFGLGKVSNPFDSLAANVLRCRMVVKQLNVGRIQRLPTRQRNHLFRPLLVFLC